jgi:hypothetical protein
MYKFLGKPGKMYFLGFGVPSQLEILTLKNVPEKFLE